MSDPVERNRDVLARQQYEIDRVEKGWVWVYKVGDRLNQEYFPIEDFTPADTQHPQFVPGLRFESILYRVDYTDGDRKLVASLVCEFK